MTEAPCKSKKVMQKPYEKMFLWFCPNAKAKLNHTTGVRSSKKASVVLSEGQNPAEL